MIPAFGDVKAELLTEITKGEVGRYCVDDNYGCEEKHNGCLTYFGRVTLADGTDRNINKIQVGDQVLGVDPEGQVVTTKVTQVFNNGKSQKWLKISGNRTKAGRGRAFFSVICTPLHRFFLPLQQKYVRAGELQTGDVVNLLRQDVGISPVQEQILLGMLLGDASISYESAYSARVAWSHRKDDEEYMNWIARGIGSLAKGIGSDVSGFGTDMLCSYTCSNAWVYKTFQSFKEAGRKKRVPEWVVEKLTPLALAFWYMDDGSLGHNSGQEDRASLATCGFTRADCKILIRALKKFDINADYRKQGGYGCLELRAVEAEKLFLIVAPYIPPCMQRKLPERYRGHSGWLPDPGKPEFKPLIVHQTVTSITEETHDYAVKSNRYDIETETHNYFANRILVHNSRKIVYKDASGIRTTNREGEPSGHALPTHVINAFRVHPLPTFVIDIEFEEGIAVVLDVINLGGLDFSKQRYDKRKEAARMAFENRNAFYRVCKTITGERTKSAFIHAKKAEKAEGVCFKKMDAPYKAGKNGQHKKYKFWKSLDAVVMGPNPEGHNSVEVGLYRADGKLYRICGVSLNGKPTVKVGDVLELDYLYGTASLKAVQVDLVRVRDDKKPRQCTIDQLIINKNFK